MAEKREQKNENDSRTSRMTAAVFLDFFGCFEDTLRTYGLFVRITKRRNNTVPVRLPQYTGCSSPLPARVRAGDPEAIFVVREGPGERLVHLGNGAQRTGTGTITGNGRRTTTTQGHRRAIGWSTRCKAITATHRNRPPPRVPIQQINAPACRAYRTTMTKTPGLVTPPDNLSFFILKSHPVWHPGGGGAGASLHGGLMTRGGR